MRLADLQRQFTAYVLRRPNRMLDLVAEGGAPADLRLGVYAHAYGARLAEVLANDYPQLRSLLGEAEFERLALAYLAQHPSDCFNARWFGRHLAGFLASAQGWCERPELAELAALIWAVGEAFDAADVVPATPADAGSLPQAAWLNLRLEFLPSLRLVATRWDVAPLVRAAAEAMARPRRLPEPVLVAVWRPHWEVEFRVLDPDEAVLLRAAGEGAEFGDLCQLLLSSAGETAAIARAVGLIRLWLEQGLIARLEHAAPLSTG
ncbi:MAG: DUF2063 domain-containing protein [Alphaproteobacteria bacterium]|nr:DUF2063 domain-containing protein [Alphaproteobacteria bacterium]